MGGGGGGFGNAQDWNFKSNIDPEELFRNIFGNQGNPFAGFGGGATQQVNCIILLETVKFLYPVHYDISLDDFESLCDCYIIFYVIFK